MPELDTEKLEALIASAQHGTKYKVFLIDATAGVTADALKANPGYTGRGFIMSGEGPDASGKANIALQPKKSDIENKLKALPADAQLASFVVGYGEDPADIQAAAGPVFTLPQPTLEVKPEGADVKVGEKGKATVEFTRLDSISLKIEPANLATLSSTGLTAPGEIQIEGKSDGKATITATGSKAGKQAIEKKFDVQITGPTLKLEKFEYAP